jgi:group I intron endonuclease
MIKVYGKIYLLTNLANGKKYVGQTTYTLRVRFQRHFNNARHPGKKDLYLYKALRKYGKESFEISLLCSCYSKEELDLMEDLYIAVYNTINPNVGYNRKRGGAFGKQSEETKRLASHIRTGKKRSPESLQSFREAMRKSGNPRNLPGWKHSEQAKEKMRETNSRPRKPRSPETKKKLSDYWKIHGVGSENRNYNSALPTEEIGSLYSLGYSLSKLGKKYRVTTGTIKRRLLESGIVLRCAGAPSSKQRLLM